MRASLLAFTCLLLITFLGGCSEEDIIPCLHARVVDLNDPCSGGVVLELSEEALVSAEGLGGSGVVNKSRFVTVDNLPDNLKRVGTTFTCQIKDTEEKPGRLCQAIYIMYEAATITNICSQPVLPR